MIIVGLLLVAGILLFGLVLSEPQSYGLMSFDVPPPIPYRDEWPPDDYDG